MTVLILNWFTLETLLRMQHWGLWAAIVGALVATLAGGFTYFLSQQTAARREEAFQEELVGVLTHKNQTQDVSASRLEEVQELLDRSEKRSELFLNKIEAMERELQVLRAEKDRDLQVLEPGEDRIELPVDHATSLGVSQRSKFLRALQDKPAGQITLVTVSGQSESSSLALELKNLLDSVGWSVQVRSEVFSAMPQHLYLVVRSLEEIPEPAKPLSLGLSLIDLMEIPASVRVDPSRPPNSLEMVIGVSQQETSG